MQYRISPLSFLPNGSSLLFTVLCRSWTTQAILDGGLCVWGLSSVQMHPLINWAVCFLLCTPFFFFFFKSTMWRSVSGPSDSPCPQAIINHRHVSSAQTPPSLPPLYDTGCIIILTSNNNKKMPLQSWCWRNFLPLPSVSRLYQAFLRWRLPLNAQNSQRRNQHLWWMCWCFLWGWAGFTGSWLTT